MNKLYHIKTQIIMLFYIKNVLIFYKFFIVLLPLCSCNHYSKNSVYTYKEYEDEEKTRLFCRNLYYELKCSYSDFRIGLLSTLNKKYVSSDEVFETLNMFKDITDIVFSTIEKFNSTYPSNNFMNVSIQEEMISQLLSIGTPFKVREIKIIIESMQQLCKKIRNLEKGNKSKFILKKYIDIVMLGIETDLYLVIEFLYKKINDLPEDIVKIISDIRINIDEVNAAAGNFNNSPAFEALSNN